MDGILGFLFSGENRSYFLLGTYWLLKSILSFFFPRIVVSKKLEQELIESGESLKRYRILKRVNEICFGLVFLVTIFVPLPIRDWVFIPSFVVVLASLLWCNKRFLGRFRAAKW